jgi:hypothetical protein
MTDVIYVESGYWDDGYVAYIASADLVAFSDSLLSTDINILRNYDANFTAVCSINVQAGSRQSSDKLYIELDYFNPEDYYVYAAEATVAFSSQFSQNCDASVIVGAEILEFESSFNSEATTSITVSKIASGSSTLLAEFTQTVTISHIEGADLFAFTEAQMAIEVSAIRDHDIVASTVFDVALDFVRTRTVIGEVASEFSQVSDAERSRSLSIETEAAFSFVSSLDGTLEAQSNLDTTAEIFCVISHILGADLIALSDASFVVDAERIRDNISDLDAVVEQSTDVLRIKQLASDAAAEFFKTIDSERSRDNELAVTAAFSTSCDVEQIFGTAVLLSSSGSLTVSGQYLLGGISAGLNTRSFLEGYPRVLTRNISIVSGLAPQYREPVLSPGGKFGNYLTYSTGTLVSPTSPIFWTGSEFVTTNTTTKWSSTDGINWTTSTFTGGIAPTNFSNGVYFNDNQQFSTDLNTWTNINLPVAPTGVTYTTFSPARSTGGTGWSMYATYSSSNNNRQGLIYFTRNSLTTGTWTSVNLIELGSGETWSGPFPNSYVDSNGNLVFFNRTSLGTTFISFNGSAVQTVSSYNFAESSPNVSFNSTICAAFNTANDWMVSLSASADPFIRGALRINSTTAYRMPFRIRSVSHVGGYWWLAGESGLYRSETTSKPTNALGWVRVNTDVSIAAETQNFTRVVSGNGKFVFKQRSYNPANNGVDGEMFVSSDATTFNTVIPSGVTNLTKRISYKGVNSTDLGTFASIDFWGLGTTVPIIIFKNQSFGDIFRISQLTATTTIQVRRLRTPGDIVNFNPYVSNESDWSVSFSAPTVPLQWHHYRLLVSGSTVTLYRNGVKLSVSFGSNTTFPGFNLGSPEVLISSSVDEFLISDQLLNNPDDATFSVPTSKWINNSNTDLLLHFDKDFSDDSAFDAVTRATITSTSALIFNGGITISLDADLSAESVLTAEGELNITEAQAELTVFADLTISTSQLVDSSSDFEVSTDLSVQATRIQESLVEAVTEFTLILDSVVTRAADADLSADFELFAIISHIEGADIVADSFAALDADVEKITESDISIQSEFTQSTDVNRLLDVIAVFETTSDIEISSVVIADAVSALNSEFAQDTDVLRLRDLSSSLDSESDLAVEINYTAESPADLDSESQLSTDAGRIQQGEIFTESVATKLAIVVKVGSVVLDMPVVSDLAVDIVGTLEAQADLASEFTFTGSGTGRANGDAAISSEFTQITDAEATKPFDSAFVSEFTVFALAIKDSDVVVDLSSESSLAADSNKFVGVSSDLLSEFAQTSTEDLFKAFDSALTSTVELDITAAKTATAESSIESEFNLDCTISHIEGADIVADSFAELYIQYFVGKVGSGDLQAETEITVANDRIRDHDSSQTTEASIFAEILRLRNFSSDLTADTVQTAAVNAILSADSNSISTTELFCVISHIEGADIVADSFAELEITANIVKTANSDLIAAATLDAQAMVLVGLTSDQTVTATVAADAMVMFSLTGNLNSAFSQTALGGVIEQASADLVASGGLLAVGRDIRLDTKVYVIPPETRIYSIAAETRIDSIDSETRIFTIRSTR